MKTRYHAFPVTGGTTHFVWALLLFSLSAGSPARAQIAEWTFENISSAVPALPIDASYKIPQISASASLSGGNNNGSPDVCSGSETWSTNFWPTGSSRSAGDYIEFWLRADPAETIGIGYFGFSASASSTSSALDFDVYYSSNNFTTSTYLFSGSHSTSSCSFHGSGLDNVLLPGSFISFRIFPYGQNVAAQAASIRIDDVIVEGALLPVSLMEFSAVPADRQVILEWTTAGEVNNDYFAVERSQDGAQYTEIGHVPGAGNSQSEQRYRFLDQHPPAGDNYYRLRQVDFDGTLRLHPVVHVQIQAEDQLSFRIWPTVAHDYLNVGMLSTQEETVLQIWSLNGQPVRRIYIEPKTSRHQLTVGDLPAGWYVLQYQSARHTASLRFFKQ